MDRSGPKRTRRPRIASEQKRRSDMQSAARTRSVASVPKKLRRDTNWDIIPEAIQESLEKEAQDKVRATFLANKNKNVHLSGAKVANDAVKKVMQKYFVFTGNRADAANSALNAGTGTVPDNHTTVPNVDNHEEDEEQQQEEEEDEDLPSETLEYLLTGTDDLVNHARRLREHSSDKKKESIDKAIQGLEAVHDLFVGIQD
ncbi:hypothetical protein F5B20DRAFT_583805 [Whalleya microplaca]|nr:hypothetical protein F5B20DRAFT_583805 [Whalleya microplaca]